MNKFYGSRLCPDCLEAFDYLDSISYKYEFIDITRSMEELKEFLVLRDTREEFKIVKKEGHVGIPTILTEDNKLIVEDEVFNK